MTAIDPPERRPRLVGGGQVRYYSETDACAVYRVRDADRQVIYVGWSHDPKRRIEGQHAQRPWGKEIASWSARWYPDRATAKSVESVEIEQLKPRHNIYGVEPTSRRRCRMTTPTTPEGRTKWDHLRWPDNVLAAWMDPGDNPEWHARAQQVVRAAMPLVADILDLEADKKLHPPEQRRTRRLREPGQVYPDPPWRERDEGSDR